MKGGSKKFVRPKDSFSQRDSLVFWTFGGGSTGLNYTIKAKNFAILANICCHLGEMTAQDTEFVCSPWLRYD
jgi:hypothetical protein